MAFTHLHLHTEYSLLDGATRIEKAVARAKELGMDSLAITDHGVMFGVIDFYKECQKQGIKPIIGCEVYVAPRTRFDKDTRDREMGHLILLAENNEGYKNLTKIVSRSFTEGFYYKPRVDRELLKEYSGGLIATSACLAGHVQRKLLNGNYEGAKEEALAMEQIFGKGNFFLELQNQGLPDERQVLPLMMRLREETGLEFVATNDVHYISKEDAPAHDVLLCIQTGATLDEEDRMRFPNDQFYLKSEDEMRPLFKETPEALDNTQRIADRCHVSFDFNNYHIPDFVSPDGFTNADYLRHLCEEGLKERYRSAYRAYRDREDLAREEQKVEAIKEKGDVKDKDRSSTNGTATYSQLKERLDYELSVITGMGYVEYFLIVWDFISYAKNHGIMVGPGRGSAAGSIVAYCLKITNIDPIRYNLIFERFLNPERISMPDIDIDFCYERRNEVIDYVVSKYGKERVSQIVTFGTMKARAAVRDVGRVLGVSYQETDAIAKAIPFDLHITIEKALQMNPDLKKMYEENATVKRVLDVSRAIEGMPRHTSTHAAGVVISKENIEEYVPLYLSDKGISTQFTMTTIEELGLLKMDFLGLRNLTVIRDALEMIETNHGISIDFENLSYDDPAVYEMIAKGNTQGIFQLESAGMTAFMKNLRPDCFEDIIAGIALYRPGPMASIPTYIDNKKHPQHVTYLHESLAPILSVTYGCIVYQEQVMQIVRDLAGYTYGQSDVLRRAMSKKKMEVMLAEKEKFVAGAGQRGVPKDAAEQIYNQMVSFAAYAFNKSHAAAYAVVGYETGYLKCHYPTEFMAALMTSVMGEAGSIAKYMRNCNEMNIPVLPPDVNESGKKFTVTKDGRIRFGLLGIKNLGEAAIDAIIEARERRGNFTDLYDFVEGIDTRAINKRALESLIKAGAFDSVEPNRAALLAAYESILESAQGTSKNMVQGQMSLFQTNEEDMENAGGSHTLPAVKNFDSKILSTMEKEMLGVYLTDHPLNDYRQILSRVVNMSSDVLAETNQKREEEEQTAYTGTNRPRVYDGQKVTMAGLVTHVKGLITKKNQQMAFVDLEDYYGITEVVVFPRTYSECSSLLHEDEIIVVTGSVSFKEEEAPKLLADRIVSVAQLAPPAPKGTVKVRVPAAAGQREDRQALLDELLAQAAAYQGESALYVYLGEGKPVKAGAGVTGSPAFLDILRRLFGEENVKYEPPK